MNFLRKQVVLVFDCLDGQHVQVEKSPFRLTQGSDADLRIPTIPPGEGCAINIQDSVVQLLVVSPSGEIQVNGEQPNGMITLKLDEDYAIKAGESLLIVRLTRNPQIWLNQLKPNLWMILAQDEQTVYGPCDFSTLAQHIATLGGPSQKLVYCQGMKSGFRARHILNLFPPPAPEPVEDFTPAEIAGTDINAEYGEFTCPVCWLRFDRGDVMHISVHGSLLGDPMLGDAALQRFHATRFNDRGQALDPMGIPAPDMACPHCRRKLPPGFLDLPHHIFSIIGAPSAGKSYYLSVLVKMLAASLYQNFGISFRDADPSENVLLNDMKTQLFSAATPQEAALAKTQLEGAMYERLPRFGRKVALPRPFIFQLGKHPDPGFSIVFYDNAGEHFEPTRNSSDSPGAQHIAAASGLFFLFDPLTHPIFRRKLGEIDDPQMSQRRSDQQEIILAECEARLKAIMGIESGQRVTTPLAVIVGKCDTWLHLLGPQPLGDPVRGGTLNLGIILANSARVRALLLELAPEIVANAEAISNEVVYFAASPLGSSPVEFLDGEGHPHIGPDPAKLSPRWVEIPTLWALSRIAPSLVPPTSQM